MFKRGGCVYILTNKYNKVLYVGVTSDLHQRVWEHKNKVYPKGFASKYNCDKLIYYNFFPTIEEAIMEEKRIKGHNREYKLSLVKSLNTAWIDLFDSLEDG